MKHHTELLDELLDLAREGTLTLTFGARDEAHNDAVVLTQLILSRSNGPFGARERGCRLMGTFGEAMADGLGRCLVRATSWYRDNSAWKRLQRHTMLRDFGWERSARRYLGLYMQRSSVNEPRNSRLATGARSMI